MPSPDVVGILMLIYLGQKLATLFFFAKSLDEYSTEKRRVAIDGTIHLKLDIPKELKLQRKKKKQLRRFIFLYAISFKGFYHS